MADIPAENDDFIIRTQNLTRRFQDNPAVDNLSFCARRGELFGIVGPDGAGKTTTMRMLAGILPPTSGNAWVDGVSIKDDPEELKEHIAYMPQRFGLYQDLTVLENLVFYADLFRVPKKERTSRMEKLLGFSRLTPFTDRLAGALSGGMKQKLGLACALIHSPRLLLLDEPTNGVDPVSRRDFWKILYDLLQDGISILITTAYLDEAERTNCVGLMHNGKMIQHGPPQEIKKLVVGSMFELITDDPDSARKYVTPLPSVMDVNVFGDGLHVLLKSAESASLIGTVLAEKGIGIISFRRIQPSMEDAFLSLIPKPK